MYSYLNLYKYNITDGRYRQGVTRLARAGRMTCKVRRDFKIITDV